MIPQYKQLDEDRVRRIKEGGIPQAILEWDRWSTPSCNDIHCIWALIQQELNKDTNCFESNSWLYLGEDPLSVPGLGPEPLYATTDMGGAPITATVEGPEETMAAVEALSLEEGTMEAGAPATTGFNDPTPMIESNDSMEGVGEAAATV